MFLILTKDESTESIPNAAGRQLLQVVDLISKALQGWKLLGMLHPVFTGSVLFDTIFG